MPDRRAFDLIKQRLPDKRARTVELIDELSRGVTHVFIDALRFFQGPMPALPSRPSP
jgi:hypothetical protein